MQKRKKIKPQEEFDIDQMRAYMTIPTREKFKFMEEASAFFRKAMSPEAKRAAEILRKKGW